MEGVVRTPEEADEIEEFSDMEGVEREGLYASRHAPAEGEDDPVAPRPTAQQKGKGKQAAPAVPRTILKRPKTAEPDPDIEEATAPPSFNASLISVISG